MVKKIDVLGMGITAGTMKQVVDELNGIEDVSLECKTYDLFKTGDLIRARLSLETARADIVVFYWDINLPYCQMRFLNRILVLVIPQLVSTSLNRWGA